jgi:hypothetical protein
MSHYTNRYNFWNENKQKIALIDRKYNSYSEFEKSFFKNETNFYTFFNLMRDQFNFGEDLKTLYSIFACDLEWAKKTVFCGGSGSATTTPGTSVFACIEAAHTSGRAYTPGRTQLHIARTGGSKHIFKNDYNFTYLKGTGRHTGTWACDGTNNYKITLTNGQTYSSKDHKWSPVPQTPPPTPAPTTGGGATSTALTAEDLKNGKFVKSGMKGDIVGKIQELLISKGYKNISKDGKVDKIFGGRTKKMVKDFQSANNLKDDGAVGPLTWAKLNDSSAVSASTTTSTTSSSTTTPEKIPFISGSDAIVF